MHTLEIKEEADKIFSKLSKKNPKQLRIIYKKIQQIRANPDHSYKFLKNPLQMFNRVHIDKHFVLVFKLDQIKKTLTIYYFNHHDTVYKWKPKTE
ncbi:MAG: addiction module toxin RelE [Nanoarchaeota archaeon]|nr:addiction module toxin RelE [Nanoarchaeota archaeon]